MQKEEEYFTTRNKIIQITKDLKSHYNHGEFLDIDKNFSQLLDNIIVNPIINQIMFYKNKIFTDIIY